MYVTIVWEKFALRRNICDVRGVLATDKKQIKENGFQELTGKYNDTAEMKEFGPNALKKLSRQTFVSNNIAFMVEITI